jgi:acyl-CoA dehydrogenase
LPVQATPDGGAGSPAPEREGRIVSEADLLEATAGEIFERGGAELWSRLETAGLTDAEIPEELSGSVIRLTGYFAAPVPLAETAMIGGWLLASAGLTVPAGPITATAERSLELEPAGDGWVLSGTAERVPWARGAETIAVLAGCHVARVPAGRAAIQPGENLAGEPRDSVVFAGVGLGQEAVAPAAVDAGELRARGALARALAMAGALERILELSVRHAREREQFGRPIGSFQAVQQELALLAAEVAAARAAVDLAIERPEPLWIAVAKIRAGDAASVGAAIAHQIHGAIGYTLEHELNLFTRRLWAWRDEYGSEHEWAAKLGELVVASGADGLWPLLTDS